MFANWNEIDSCGNDLRSLLRYSESKLNDHLDSHIEQCREHDGQSVDELRSDLQCSTHNRRELR